jgi:ribosomal protein S18 acetylase RimI-like enzyme
MEWVNLKTATADPQVKNLLSMSIGPRTDIEKLLAQYETEDQLHLHGIFLGTELLGIIGFQVAAPVGKAVIRHIAVLPSLRRRGVGRTLVDGMRNRFSVQCLTAETDADGVEFYRKLGFSVLSLGEMSPGRERFACTLHERGNINGRTEGERLSACDGAGVMERV